MEWKKLVKIEPPGIGELVLILLTVVSIVVTLLLSIRHATSEIRDSVRAQTEQTKSEIKDDMSKQAEQINAKMQAIFKDVVPVVVLREGEVKVFPDDVSSSFTVSTIDPEEGEVAIQTNINGELRNVALSMGRTATISIPQGGTYHLILTGIEVTEGSRIARIVISKEKGVEQ